MATYFSYLSNQTEIISSPYLKDQMYLPDQALSASYTELLSTDGQRNEVEFISQMGNTSNFESHDGEQNLGSQGLSLSLGTQFPPSIDVPVYHQYQYDCPEGSHLFSPHILEYDFGGYKSSDPSPTMYNFKYMKAVQELLDEVVSVQKTIKQPDVEKQRKVHKFELFGSKEMEMKMNLNSSDGCDSSKKDLSEISPLEKQQLKEKLANLCSIVHEVDRRYRKYCHQMQIVVSSFETVAGHGAARSYTALALCTISRQFRSLRDAINEQIVVIRQKLGEKDATTPSVEGKLTRLRIVDQQLRQQKTIQQFGAIRNTWRPQRGLPGNSVSVLRAWLFEHFLHPYPKDLEKIMLSRQTGLTRGQVANWFINARVRLWKPMVEEMYKEEFGDMDSSSSPDPSPRTPKTPKKWNSFDETREDFKNIVTLNAAGDDDSKPTLIPGFGLKGCTARLGFQNGPHEHIDFKIAPCQQNGDVGSSDFNLAYAFPQKDSLVMASSEMHFGDNYEQDYNQIDDSNLLPDFVA